MKMNRTLLKVAIMCVGVQDIGAGASTPVLGAIIAAFPTVKPSLVMMIATIPSLCLVLFSPVYAWLTQFLRKKTILGVAAVCFLVGGTAPVFMDNIYLILVMRALLGIGIGFIVPMAVDLAVDFFEGPERQTMVGLVSAVASLGGIMFQLLGGYFAKTDWHNCFYAYLISIVFFTFALVFLPNIDCKKRSANGEAKPKIRLPVSVWVVCLLFMIWEVFFFVLITNTAIVMGGEKIGDTGAIGVAFTMLTVGSLITSTFYGKIYQWLKNASLSVSILLSLIGFILFYFSKSFSTVTISIFVIGFSMGLVIPSIMSKVTNLVPRESSTFAISMSYTAMGIGGFLQPFVFEILLKMFNQVPGRFPFIIAIYGFVVLFIAAIIISKYTPIRKEEAICAADIEMIV